MCTLGFSILREETDANSVLSVALKYFMKERCEKPACLLQKRCGSSGLGDEGFGQVRTAGGLVRAGRLCWGSKE
jgi:hypothetical protein